MDFHDAPLKFSAYGRREERRSGARPCECARRLCRWTNLRRLWTMSGDLRRALMAMSAPCLVLPTPEEGGPRRHHAARSNPRWSAEEQRHPRLSPPLFLAAKKKKKKKEEKINHASSEWHLKKKNIQAAEAKLRGGWRDCDTNDIFAHCSLVFYFLDFKFSNFVCPSELHPLIWFFFKKSFRKKKNIQKTAQNALAPSIFIVLSIVLKLGTPLLHTQAQNRLLQNF